MDSLQQRVSRVSIILPANPVRDDKVHARGNDQHDEILVVCVLGKEVERLGCNNCLKCHTGEKMAYKNAS